MVLDEKIENDILNIGANEELSIRGFAEEICKIVDYDSHLIEYDESKYVGAESKFLSTEKEKNILGKLTRTSLNDGLKKTIDWFEDNINF